MKARSKIVVITIVVAIVSALASLLFVSKAHAVDDQMVWSWTAVKPTVLESVQVSNVSGSEFCSMTYRSRTVIGESNPRQVCMFSNDDVRFGNYYIGYAYPTVVSFGYDDKMYHLRGSPCDRYDSCLYLPDTDMLLTKQYLINGNVRSLIVYKNFTKRLTRTVNSLTFAPEYLFNGANPDFIFKNSDGYAWPIGGMGASRNGKWVAVAMRDKGVGLLNTETMTMRRITTMSFYDGGGTDPTTEFAVSEDGRHVAIMGMNAGFMVLDVGPECGDEVNDINMLLVLSIANRCKVADIWTGDFINRFYTAYHPIFNDEGAELTFYAMAYGNDQREVTLRAGGYESQRIDYLALGDSFSSGEGETSDDFYLDGTNDPFEKCHISTRSYPFLIAEVMGIEAQYMRSVACSGAMTGDVVDSYGKYVGQGERLLDPGLNLNLTQINVIKTATKQNFNPGRVSQESFVGRYHPKIITLGIGGNDAGFMDKLHACLSPKTCQWAATAEGREKTALEIRSLYPTLVETYGAIREASPQSKLYVVGYPQIINEVGECGFVDSMLLDAAERRFMQQGIIYLNQVIKDATIKAGVAYVDITESFGSKTLCGTTIPSVMNGLTRGDDFGINEQMDWMKIIGQESFHPRPTGHTLTAASIVATIPNMLTYDYCQLTQQRTDRVCPSRNHTVTEPSSYWLVDNATHGYQTQRIGRFTHDNQTIYDKKIILPEYSLQPGSTVQIEVHSDPVNLGTFTVDMSGALEANVTLPDSTEEGYHTVHIYGTSYSGEVIDVYEVIPFILPRVAVIDIPTTSIDDPQLVPADVDVNEQQVALLPHTSDSGEIVQHTTDQQSEVLGAHTIAVVDTTVVETKDSVADSGITSTNGTATQRLILIIIGMVICATIITIIVTKVKRRNRQ